MVLIASTCFGTLGVFSSLFYDDGGVPWTLLFLRFVVAGPVLGIAAFVLKEPWPGRRLALIGASLGVFQLGVGVGLLEGFERAPIALVSLLYFAYPLMVAVGATLIYRETLSARRVIILAVALTGVALIIGIPGSANRAGIVLGLIAALCVTGAVLSSQRLMRTDGISPIVLSALMFTSPALVLRLVLPVRAPDFGVSGPAWGVGALRRLRLARSASAPPSRARSRPPSRSSAALSLLGTRMPATTSCPRGRPRASRGDSSATR